MEVSLSPESGVDAALEFPPSAILGCARLALPEVLVPKGANVHYASIMLHNLKACDKIKDTRMGTFTCGGWS